MDYIVMDAKTKKKSTYTGQYLPMLARSNVGLTVDTGFLEEIGGGHKDLMEVFDTFIFSVVNFECRNITCHMEYKKILF